ncbi:hypothetical protein [Nevskia ramosa]|uniref:hypothetical protein n=1 Tax=Nevskia ramosa TaxID=64002 RepID=UPI001FDF2B1D|nr:hypothetical protein [Nevskia ramosa]
MLAKQSNVDYAGLWVTPTRATVGLNSTDDLPEDGDPSNLWFTPERARAAVEASNAAMGVMLLADLPAAAAENADRVFVVRKSAGDARRIMLICDGAKYQYLNSASIIDASANESADMVLAAAAADFSTGVIVVPGKLIQGRTELDLDFDVLFQSASASNAVSVTADGLDVFVPPGTASTRRYAGVCRLFFNAAGTAYRQGAHLSGFGYGTASGGGYLTEFAHTPGADLTLRIRALGVVGEAARLWRWRLRATG